MGRHQRVYGKQKEWIVCMKNNKKREKSQKIRLPKPVGIGIFYAVCLIVAIIVLTHNNPLAPDQDTENLKKFCACALLLLACIIFGVYYDRLLILPKELIQSRELIWKLSKNDTIMII